MKSWFQKTRSLILLLLLLFTVGFTFHAAAVTTEAATNGFRTVGEKTYYYKNSKKVTGWITLNGKKYYLNPDDGSLKKGWTKDNGKGRRYFDSKTGVMYTGLKKVSGKYYYFNPKTGLTHSGWLKYSKTGKKRYFNTQNYTMTTGWVRNSSRSKERYFDPKSGYMLTGMQKIGGKYYYFGSSGLRSTGLAKSGKYYYYFNSNGTLATGWKTVSGKRYYFNKKGRAVTGTVTVNKTKYYFGKNGVLSHSGANLSISSDCAILVEADTGKVIFAQNENARHANASTTKIMTFILALQNSKMTDTVTFSANAASQEPTKLYAATGSSFKMKDLLHSLLIPSHNDTAVAIAEHVAGSTQKFAEMMNQKAKDLGCTSTNFVTPNGLDNGLNHYTTASDLSKIARYAWKSKTFRNIVGKTSYTFSSLQGNSFRVTTTNALLGNVPGVCGMKTGYTNKAGHCFVGVVKSKKGKYYISVTLGGSTSAERWTDAKTLLNYAYKLS